MVYKGVRERVVELIEPVVKDRGLELVEVEYKMGSGGWILRVYIDKAGGVTIDDCVDVSQEVGVILDVNDPIPHSYNLEVSSPGLDRPLRKREDFLRFKGERIKLRCIEPIGNRKNFKGVIKDVEGELVLLMDTEGHIWEIPTANIDSARLIISL